jgi:GT2 family glycosyltransferase
MKNVEKITYNDFIIVVPYINAAEIASLKARIGWKPNIVFWEDKGRVGSDIAYQTLWNMYPDKDIIILHADMSPMPEDTNNLWLDQLIAYVNQFPEAGIFGTTLLYPAKNKDSGNYYIQHAGGQFKNGEAIHIGGGLELSSGQTVRTLEEDSGQFDGKIREVPWVTFGGIYIRRSLLRDCGNFDPSYYWTYYRDVDYCITARSRGWKVYQTPAKLLHFEGKDNKQIQASDKRRVEQVNINHAIFYEKWKGSDLLNNIDEVIYSETPKESKKEVKNKTKTSS